ncbi:MAG: TRAP transporter substrate-binding protein [Candidatus Ventricola sp.]|nr:TRAP transporter substrate-binding protein [Clostridiales bacterium]MDY3762621.1 TRAP transporter substrate-binding protein [Candidatus Ventricola sp.]
MKKLATLILALVFVCCAALATADMGPTLNFKLAENQPEGNPITEGMHKFADLVKEYTEGTVTIDVYSNAALTDEASSVDQLQLGSLDFSRVNTNSLAPTVDEFGVFAMPYLFTSTEQKYKALDGEAGDAVMAKLEDYGMVGLYFWEAGARCFYTTSKPIRTVEDLKGMKIRVQQTEVAISMVRALGAEATPMDYAEVFQGLQTGIVDGAENDFVSYYTSGHYEVAKYYSLDQHMAPPAVLLMSKASWDKMSEAQQEAVRKAAYEAAVWQRQAMQDYQQESRAACEAAGCEIIDVDVASFQQAVSSVYDEYPRYSEIVAMINAVE